MRSKDYLKQIAESKGVCPLTNEVKDNALLFPIGFEYIFQDLDRLEELEKGFKRGARKWVKENANIIEDNGWTHQRFIKGGIKWVKD